MSWNSTVTCSWCYKSGHNRRGCPSRKEYVHSNPDSYEARQQSFTSSRARRCSYCSKGGHNRRTCSTIAKDKSFLVEKLAYARPRIMQKFRDVGFGIGALMNDDCWGRTCLVTHISWSGLDHTHLPMATPRNPSPHANGLSFLVRAVESSKSYTLHMTLDELAKNLLSPTSKNGLVAPSGWLQGTIYDEEQWFDKKGARSYFFTENNEISS